MFTGLNIMYINNSNTLFQIKLTLTCLCHFQSLRNIDHGLRHPLKYTLRI